MIRLRPHQVKACEMIDGAWATAGVSNVLCVSPTASGKTILMGEYARRAAANNQPVILFAHRDELVGQISNALCMMGIHHCFVASDKAIKRITNANLAHHGDSYYCETSLVVVSSVPTFAARVNKPNLQPLLAAIRLWIVDECHHHIVGGMWDNATKPLVNAVGLGVTATPLRGDGKGLGRHHDGVFDEMMVVTTTHELIQNGALTPYKIFAPEVLVDTSGMSVGSNGDLNQKELAKRTDKVEITGDAVEHYNRVLSGKRVITFTVNIEHGLHVAEQFNHARIPSKAVSSKTPDDEREQAIEDFKAGRILNLVNCDLFGEGFDVPAVEGVIMLRKTESFALFKQQFGRLLRLFDGKIVGILLDHVGNTVRMIEKYNLRYPHDDPHWSLDRVTKRKKNDDGEKLAETNRCSECALLYTVYSGDKTCPDCGHIETQKEKEKTQRDLQAAKGQLMPLSVDIIDNLIAARTKVDLPITTFSERMVNQPSMVRHSAVLKHTKRQHAQTQLRREIQQWCVRYGIETGYGIGTVQAEFERIHRVNVFKAQSLSERESLELMGRIIK